MSKCNAKRGLPINAYMYTLGYLWMLLLCKPCFYELCRQAVATLSDTGRRTFSNSGMFRQPVGHEVMYALCQEMLLLMPERCFSSSLAYTLVSPWISPLFQK
ncbi:TPA: hypothetical protein ACH3X1_015725 [Trebouxia sp. C0004]